jgi:hypothetical protein
VTLGVMIIVAVLLVLGVGYLIFRLMRRTQTVVPKVTDEDAASRDHVVGIDDQGREIMASQEAPEPTRDAAGFENLLKDEIHEQGREEPAAPEED